MATQEHQRLREAHDNAHHWKKWGPYLSERQWGTVREDYSASGNAWDYFSHEQARARAYRWGEDGIAGISDDQQQLCFALAFWNGADAILKERIHEDGVFCPVGLFPAGFACYPVGAWAKHGEKRPVQVTRTLQ